MNDYTTGNVDLEDEQWYEKYDDIAKDEEWNIPTGIPFDDSEDNLQAVVKYLNINSDWLKKNNKI